MVWHDCKTDPPKISGRYILACKDEDGNLFWVPANYYSFNQIWLSEYGIDFDIPLKWTEVDLSEVE